MEEKYKETIKRIQPIAETFIVNNKLQYPIKDSLTLLSNIGYYKSKSAKQFVWILHEKRQISIYFCKCES